jgi:hypothetical protein
MDRQKAAIMEYVCRFLLLYGSHGNGTSVGASQAILLRLN